MPNQKQQIRFCTGADGVRLAYATSGRGPVLVKAANWLSHLEFDWERPVWRSLLDERSSTHALVRYDERAWGRENPAFRQFFTTQFIPDGTPEQHKWFNELARISTSPQNAGRFMRVFNAIDVTSKLPQVQCPTLVLHSTRDARVPFAEGRLLASLVPGARFAPLESNNHLLLATEPAWQRWRDEVHAFLPAAERADPLFATLTPRERELVELIAQGCDNAQIGARLDLREKTVRNHITSIFAKLEVENRSQAIVLARDAGFGRARTSA